MEWRPIETAPKDGRCVLIVKDCGYGTLPSVSISQWMGGYWNMTNSIRSLDDYGYRATHWMPLPEPPRE